MRRMAWTGWLAGLATACVIPVALGEPALPASVRASERLDDWQLQMTHTPPQRILVTLPGGRRPMLFWYMIYRVENNTGQDRVLAPQFDLVYPTETAIKVVRADMGINPAVFEAIKAKHGQAYPFLTDPTMATGKLLQGEDNAKTTVAIWPAFDPRADRFSIFVAGLSGKTKMLTNPNYDPAKPETIKQKLADGSEVEVTVNPRFFTLRRMLQLDYVLPGDVVTRATVAPREVHQAWTMR